MVNCGWDTGLTQVVRGSELVGQENNNSPKDFAAFAVDKGACFFPARKLAD
jgi:hypothetical protein